MALPLDEGLALIRRAKDSRQEDRDFIQWVVQLPFMGEKTFVSFEDYRSGLHGGNIDMRPKEVILAELDEVEKEFEKGGDSYGSSDFQAGGLGLR